MLKKKKLLFFIFSFFFVLLIKLYFLFSSFYHADLSEAIAYNNADSGHYLSIARNIHNYHAFADNGSPIPNEYATWRSPIWPFTLSFLFFISHSVSFLLISKLILETLLMIYALYIYKKKLKLEWLVVLPFLLLFIEPQYLKYSFTFLSESFNSILILILTICFLNLKSNKKHNFIIPVLSAIIVLCHPVSIFFVCSFMGFYCLINLKSNFKISLLQGMIFVLLILIWPMRNLMTFHKGFYLTASQGAIFSKGWNEKVAENFTNVEGDLADESMNIKFVKDIDKKLPVKSVLEWSKLYQEGTYNYINSLSFGQKAAIALKKIKSNFNPFPESPKAGFFEDLGIVFRILYLIMFVQLFWRFFQFRKFNFDSQKDKVFLIVLCVFLGQIIMSVYVYTGFRFNAIYSVCLLFCLIVVNQNLIQKVINKIV
jgi:hypothetical protein